MFVTHRNLCFSCIVIGLLLIGVGVLLSGQHQDSEETASMQAMQPEAVVHIVTQSNQMHLSVTSVCASCHSLDSSIPLRDNSLEPPEVPTQLSQLEYKFNSVGNRLLRVDYPDDLRLAESVDNFWQIHRQMKTIQMSSSSDDMTDAIASLALIDQQITFVQHEIDFGHFHSSSPKPRPSSVALVSPSRTTFGYRQSNDLVRITSDGERATPYTVPSPNDALDLTACPRGPPATFIATTTYLKQARDLRLAMGVQSLLFFRSRERSSM